MAQVLKSLFKNSIVYGIANSVQKMIPVIVIPIITNHLGKDALKYYDVAFVHTLLFCSLMMLSLDSAASVYYFDQKKENFDKKKVLSYAFFLQAISVAFCLLLVFASSNVVGNLLFRNDLSIKRYWVLCLWYIPGYMLFNYALNVLIWKQKSVVYLTLCLINTVLSVAGSLVVVKYLNGNVADLITVQLGAITLCGMVGVFFIRDDLFISPFPLNKLLIKRLVTFGVPFALTSFFRQLIPSIDRFFLLHFHQAEQLPVYILAVKIASLFTVATYAFVLAFTPYSLDKLNHDDAEKEISGLFHVIALITFACVPVLLLFKDWLITFFGNQSYAQSAQVLPFLFLGWAFDLFAYFSMLGIYRSQNSRVVLFLLLVGTVIISVFNFLLIPLFGIFGAAMSFLLTKLLMFFVTLFYLRKHFSLHLKAASFFFTFALAAAYCYLVFRVSTATYILLLLPFLSIVLFQLRKSFSYRNLFARLSFRKT